MNYTRSIRCVHLAEQKGECYGIRKTSEKWWKYVFCFILTVAAVNSFVLHDQTNRLNT